MGKRERQKPARLAEKLQAIRLSLHLSQSELVTALGLTEELGRNHIANFESGFREPNLIALLKYARLAQITVDDLIDDEIEVQWLEKKIRKNLK